MNTCEKSIRKDTPNHPSFSSSLLDQIYRSIDESDKRPHNPTLFKETITTRKKQSNVDLKSNVAIDEDDVSSFRRARLVEQWMERKVREKMVSRRQHFSAEFDRKALYDNDPLFFSSSSCSSESSSGAFSSSGSEKVYRSKTKVSPCFPPMKLQKIRTNLYQKSAKTEETGGALFSIENNISEDGAIKSKLRALKQMKQPISPGGRISSFLNSIFATGNSKNTTKNPTSNGGFHNTDMEKTPKSTTCSSASSFSRSCLSKNAHSVKGKTSNGGEKSSVKFYPASEIMGEDHEKRKTLIAPMVKKEEDLKFQFLEEIQRKEEGAGDFDDAASDSSSDLFELDHLAFIDQNESYYCEELPVFATTNVQTNHAIC